ncbi:hypothetical protein [Burkholderia sp. D-99]|uniref:hypothetical protein n=1 Tax=Burkholderia sp. D-99 TaxID=2717316 RepID=UPI00141E2DA2|nr:hypothetical protein [Burkholderia sp. D-99]NHV25062.1 hypothetical protein [Burkholderia sp. D-99]
MGDTGGAGKGYLQFQKARAAAWNIGSASSASNQRGIDCYVSGSYVDTPFTITNATGIVSMPDGLISAGGINGTPIGATTPAAGTFVNLATNGTTTLASAPTTGSATIYPTVPTNAALLALSTATTSTVTRLGDVAPLTYTASGSACSLNSGNGDNGSQVKSANRLSWIANFPSGPRNVLEWGAYINTDASTTTPDNQAAINSLRSNGGLSICSPERIRSLRPSPSGMARPHLHRRSMAW